ncbi:ribosome-associated protein [Natranaerovirga hydrolytica]|uniref:Ribosome-associated protein n=1 Tax=Natranaerovirga hydrolytica TaxID=680378 RepID=A0A4R1M4P7_9FIRM|nr:S4 domain-containing protein YaaA [Natranaerovirga hydrolytica]TCK86795.1 ribosome-associated protein [Natranaerovirga hydrolytica]
MKNIPIDTEFIKLGQLLKLAGATSSGVESKIFITEGLVKVNGDVETRRGKKLYDGDVVEFENESYKVIQND